MSNIQSTHTGRGLHSVRVSEVSSNGAGHAENVPEHVFKGMVGQGRVTGGWSCALSQEF